MLAAAWTLPVRRRPAWRWPCIALGVWSMLAPPAERAEASHVRGGSCPRARRSTACTRGKCTRPSAPPVHRTNNPVRIARRRQARALPPHTTTRAPHTPPTASAVTQPDLPGRGSQLMTGRVPGRACPPRYTPTHNQELETSTVGSFHVSGYAHASVRERESISAARRRDPCVFFPPVGTQCVPSVATRVVAKIYNPFFFSPSLSLHLPPTINQI